MLSIIVAVADNGIIGDKNSLLWHIREDMLRFRRITTGHPVIMGRKTFESIGRPLPNRTNVVISRQDIGIEGCTVVHSLEEAIASFPREEEIFILGGAQIYGQAMPLADKLYLTLVHRDYDGDTSFPKVNGDEWREVAREDYECGENFDAPFSFVDYVRK